MKQDRQLCLFENFLEYQQNSSIKIIEEGDFDLNKFEQLSFSHWRVALQDKTTRD